MEQNRLGQTFLGFKLTSPVIVASGFLTRNVELLTIAEKHGAGGISTKACMLLPQEEVPLDFRPDATVLPRAAGMLIPGDKRPPGKEILKMVREIKRQGTSLMILCNTIGGGKDLDRWQYLARELEAAGCDALELNAAHPFIDVPPEVFLARFADLLAQAVKAVKDAVSIPVIVKLTPITSDLRLVAQSCEEAGADAITITNALPAAPPIDIWNGGGPLSRTLKNLTWSCLCGPAIFPIASYGVAHVAKSVKIPVIGCGGITTWQDAVQMIMWGASTVEVCAAIHLDGFQVIGQINRGLKYFMEEKGYSSIEDFRGLSLKQLIPQNEVAVKEDYRVAVREDRCNLCMRCLRIGQCLAISLRDNAIVIDNDKCVPCGTCVQICPQQAIDIQ